MFLNTSFDGFESNNCVYYGIHIPKEQNEENKSENVQKIFTDKLEALKILKKYKKSRLNCFKTRDEAAEFSKNGPVIESCQVIDNPDSADNDLLRTTIIKHAYRSLQPQDLVQFRKMIENEDLDLIKKTVIENPRYLVSSGDTPSILKEGFRYNAIHIATKCKNPEICEYILQTVSDPEFLELLFGNDMQMCVNLASKLLTAYLNTPDKREYDTPLHFASKWGNYGVVKVLMSYPQIKQARNKHGQLARDIICLRSGIEDTNLVEKIALLLDEKFFVPVLRASDNCIQPTIGEPFCGAPPLLNNEDILSPPLVIGAFAGPMSREKAEQFCVQWKTPPRKKLSRYENGSFNSQDSGDASGGGDDHIFTTPKSFHRKGLITKTSTPKHIVSPLSIVRSPINSSFSSCSSGLNRSEYRLTDSAKGLEQAGRQLARDHNVPWREYWPFLKTFTDLSTPEGLELLEKYLEKRCTTDTTNVAQMKEYSSTWKRPNIRKCILPNNTAPDRKDSDSSNETDHESRDNSVQPFLTIDRALLVFAKRIINLISHTLVDISCAVKSLRVEIKHLHIMLNSFMEDENYAAVEFSYAHCRLARIITMYLMNNDDNNELNNVKSYVIEVCKSDNLSDIQCLILHILHNLKYESKHEDNVMTEEKCKIAWKACIKCSCKWQKSKRPNHRKSSSRKLSLSMNNSKINFSLSDLNISSGDKEITADCELHEEAFCFENNEKFYSCCTSEDSEDEEFFDASEEGFDVFIDGKTFSCMDAYVFNSLDVSGLSPDSNPYVYRWKHAVEFYCKNVLNLQL